MTHDEALRALEKEMREDRDGDDVGYYADELAALLTTRQEVAPVAWEYTYYDEDSSIRQVDLSPCRFLESWQASKRDCIERPLIYGDTGQTSDARDGARLSGADERTQLLFDAKNYWADRSRELEARLVAVRDGYRDGSFSDLPGINNAAIAAKVFADELTALLERKP